MKPIWDKRNAGATYICSLPPKVLHTLDLEKRWQEQNDLNIEVPLENIIKWCQSVQEENKHLNEQLDIALKDYDELQQRIDKAIEIIDRYDFSEDNIICDIRKILKGDSNEEDRNI